MHTFYQLRLVGALLMPSFLSTIIVIVVALIGLAMPAWSYLEDNQALFDFFYGPHGMVTVFQGSPTREGFSVATDALLSLSVAYNVGVVAFSMLVGWLVFAALQVANRLTASVARSFTAVQHAGPWYKRSIKREEGQRIVARIGTLLAWLLYAFVTIKVIWPLCILMVRTGVYDLGTNWWYMAVAFGILALAFHMHVVFARLIALRPRLLGNSSTTYEQDGH